MSTPAKKPAWMKRQDRLLRQTIQGYVAPFVPFYRRMFEEQGIDPRSIRRAEDLAILPFTSKMDLVAALDTPDRKFDFLMKPDPAQLARRPDLLLRAIARRGLAFREALEDEFRPVIMTATTGRSSRPVGFLFTKIEIKRLQRSGRYLAEVFGGTRQDRVLNMFPFAPHLAFWQTHYAMTDMGLFGVSSGGGKVMGTEGNIRLMQRLEPTVLIGMPTFLYHCLTHALEEKIQCSSIRILVLGGEKVPDGMRTKLRSLCEQVGSPGVKVIATYGFTESKMAWGECHADENGGSTGYHMLADMGLVEIIDPDTGAVQPEGAPGEIVFTPLGSRGTVVLRYRTGDLVSGGQVYGRCPHCGREGPRLVGKISRRSDMKELNLAKVKGTLVDFNEVERALDDLGSVGTWVLELRKVNNDPLEIDELILHVVPLNPGQEPGPLEEQIREHMRGAVEISPNEVRFVSGDEIRKLQGVGAELKERKVIDHRPPSGGQAPAPSAPEEPS